MAVEQVGRSSVLLLLLLVLFVHVLCTVTEGRSIRNHDESVVANGIGKKKPTEMKMKKYVNQAWQDTEAEAEEESDLLLNCDEGVSGISKEDCINRRSLAAHVDYIYTQKHKDP